VPESRHRRKGANRPRPRELEPPKVKAKRSPRWVPIVGGSLLAIGVTAIITNYLVWSRNSILLSGFAVLALGFVFLTQWH